MQATVALHGTKLATLCVYFCGFLFTQLIGSSMLSKQQVL